MVSRRKRSRREEIQEDGIAREVYSKITIWMGLLQTQALRVGQVKEPCIRFIQENLIENSVQDGLPYIQIPNGLCELFLTYPK